MPDCPDICCHPYTYCFLIPLIFCLEAPCCYEDDDAGNRHLQDHHPPPRLSVEAKPRLDNDNEMAERQRAPSGCEGHMLIGFFLSLISSILLLLVSLSTPIITAIDFLHTEQPSTSFGAFGYCLNGICEVQGVGYDYEQLTRWLTTTAILFPIACGFMFLAFLSLLLACCSIGSFGWDGKWFRTFAVLGTLLAMLAEIFALVLWVTARNRFNAIGQPAGYGPALWLGLAAVIIAFVAACLGGPPFRGRYMYRNDRSIAYNL